MSTIGSRSATKSSSIAPRHGRVITPESRAVFLYEAGKLDFGQVNELEGGKFFPATQGGLRDPDAPDDVANGVPPRDGEIASGGRTADARAQLDEPDSVAHWHKHAVRSGQSLQITWSYSMPHKTRRWTYWITRPGWDASARLTRAQFESEPLKIYLNTYQPYWGPDADRELIPSGDTVHELNLPTRTGYHVLLAAWDVADTANAFYQVIDLNFA